MKIATIQNGERAEAVVLDSEAKRYLPLRELCPDLPDNWIDGMDQILAMASRLPTLTSSFRPLDSATLLAPIQKARRSIFCIGKNYSEHVREIANSPLNQGVSLSSAAPEELIVFAKLETAIIGPNAEIYPHAAVTSQLDYEAELAVVIGKAGRGILRKQALDHIFGYTILNDVTAREVQKRHKQWLLGKSLDTFCPMGPWIVTREEIDANDLKIECFVNGERRQSASTKEMIFDIPTIIEKISAGIQLLPGDIIATGTPGGVGMGFQPPRFLRRGDEIHVEIQGIGILVNRVGQA